MLTALRTRTATLRAVRLYTTQAELDKHQISRIVERVRYAPAEPSIGGAVVHAALRPKDKQSPFLVLDYATMPRNTGFPDHPHRGLTTVTQVLAGKWDHEDFLGNKGTLQPGEVQWMSAGRGIMHSEMPHFDGSEDPEPVALQLWVDMPAERKMEAPSYLGMTLDQIPVVKPSEGVEIGVISGESGGVKNEKREAALGGTWWLDVTLSKPGAEVWQPIPRGWTALIYVIEGNIQVHEGAPVDEKNTIILTKNEAENGVLLRLPRGDHGRARAALLAGPPLDQVAYTRGPFVMTNREDAYAAVEDFNHARNGFEHAKGWKSEIGHGLRLKYPKIGLE